MKKLLISAAVAILAAALLAPAGLAAGKHHGKDKAEKHHGKKHHGKKHHGKKTYTTRLKGANEVPGPGDPDGKGHATIRLRPNRDKVCFTIVMKRIAPADKGHIRVGGTQVAGPVFITLFTTPSSQKVRRGCVDATDAQIEAIRSDPSNYYVNVHNADFPMGAMRGQLRRPGH